MTPVNISPVIWFLTGAAWLSAIILVYLAWGAKVGALTERAVIAVGIAAFGTVYSLAAYNTDYAQIIPAETVKFLVRISVVFLLLLPVWWTILYATGRLGDNGKGGEK